MTDVPATAPRCVRVGDRLLVDGTEVVVTGFVVGGYDPSQPRDRTTEYALVAHPGGEEPIWLLHHAARTPCAGDGPGLFDGLEPIPLSEPWRSRFTDFLEARAGEPALARAAAQQARHDRPGGEIVVAGGSVRDALRGVVRRTGDIDLTGTLRSRRFRGVVERVFSDLAGGEPATEDDRWTFRTRPDQIVVVESPDGRSTVDYAVMRRDHRPHSLSTQPDWVFGTTLVEDVRWRDLTCNTVVLDPCEGAEALYDPTGTGLLDLGLTPADLQVDPRPQPARALCLRPIDLPPTAPVRHAAVHLVRVVAHLARFSRTDPETGPVGEWARRHEDALAEAARYREPASTEALVTRELRAVPRRHRVPEWIRDNVLRLQELLGPAVSLAVLEGLPPRRAARAGGPADVRPVPRLRSAALQVLEDRRRPDLGPIVGPSRPTVDAAQRFFADDLMGYEHTVVEVAAGEGRTDAVLALAPIEREGPTYIELDGDLQPILCTEAELDRIRKEDAGPS